MTGNSIFRNIDRLLIALIQKFWSPVQYFWLFFEIPEDVRNWTWNVAWWSDPVLLGHYPEEGLMRFAPYLPKITDEDMKIKDAKNALKSEASEKILDMESIKSEALRRAENEGIIFIDEIDKVAVASGNSNRQDPSKEGVQRDLLPIVEGSSVQTKIGTLKTDYILFIAAGAFHLSKPSDLIPELQGRFPLRVELDSLDDACRKDVGTLAEVGEVALGICGDGAILQILFDVLHLINLSCSLELCNAVCLAHLLAHYCLILASQLDHLVLDGLEVSLAYLLAVGQQHIVEEAVLYCGTKTELDAGIEFLQSLGQQVGAGVPEGMLALLIVKLVEVDGSIFVDGAVQLGSLTVHSTRHHILCQALTQRTKSDGERQKLFIINTPFIKKE